MDPKAQDRRVNSAAYFTDVRCCQRASYSPDSQALKSVDKIPLLKTHMYFVTTQSEF